MSIVTMDIFWAVLFGSVIGTLIVNLTTSIIDEYRHKKRTSNLRLLLDDLQDVDYEDYED